MSAAPVSLSWDHPETGEDFRIELTVGEAQPEIRFGEHAQEGLAGEVEIVRIVEDKVGGVERPDLLELVARSYDLLAEKARDAAEEAEKSARDAAKVFAADCARDERRFGC